MATLQHQFLGNVQGKLTNGVVQFSGIKYASLGHRFGLSELYGENGSDDKVNATRLGYFQPEDNVV